MSLFLILLLGVSIATEFMFNFDLVLQEVMCILASERVCAMKVAYYFFIFSGKSLYFISTFSLINKSMSHFMPLEWWLKFLIRDFTKNITSSLILYIYYYIFFLSLIIASCFDVSCYNFIFNLFCLSCAVFFFSLMICLPWLNALLLWIWNPKSSYWFNLILESIAFLISVSYLSIFFIIRSFVFYYLYFTDLSFTIFYSLSKLDFNSTNYLA